MNKNQKIFNIGLPRSGTTSFKFAMVELGFPCMQNNPLIHRLSSQGNYRFPDQLKHFKASSNYGQWIFPQLAMVYPQAVWVCTYRSNLDAWVASLKHHMSTMDMSKPNVHSQWMHLFGVTKFNEDRIRYVIDHHIQTIYGWMDDTGNKVLFHDPKDGWKPLLDHLRQQGVMIQTDLSYLGKYPHHNKETNHD